MSESRASAPHRVEVIRKSLERYRPIVGDDLVAEIRDRAHELRGLRVLEVSATATGGGVAEMLSSLVPPATGRRPRCRVGRGDRPRPAAGRGSLVCGRAGGVATQVPAIDPLTSKNRPCPPTWHGRRSPTSGSTSPEGDLRRPAVRPDRFDGQRRPEGWRIYGEIENRVHNEPDCFLLSDQMGVASHEANAFSGSPTW